jgi:hypothetical protein
LPVVLHDVNFVPLTQLLSNTNDSRLGSAQALSLERLRVIRLGTDGIDNEDFTHILMINRLSANYKLDLNGYNTLY